MDNKKSPKTSLLDYHLLNYSNTDKNGQPVKNKQNSRTKFYKNFIK